MPYQWAFPIGHQTPTLPVRAERRYYQPVSSRDDTNFCSGYELRVASSNADLCALVSGYAVYAHNGTIGSLTLVLYDDLASAWLDGEYIFFGIKPAVIIYENIDHASSALRNKLDQLIEYERTNPQRQSASILNSIAEVTGGNGTPILRRTLLEKLGTFGTNAYDTAKRGFLDDIIDNGSVFSLSAGSNFGAAASASSQPSDKLVRLLARDTNGQYFNPALLIDVLVRRTTRPPIKDFECLTQLGSTDLYLTPLASAFSLDPNIGRQNVQPPAVLSATAGTRDVVMHSSLLIFHVDSPSLPNSLPRVKWRYEPSNFIFEVNLNGTNTIMRYGGGSSALNFTISFQDSYKKEAPPLTTVARANATRQQRMTTVISTFYTANKTIIDDIGYYLGLPTEILLAIAGHESAGQSGLIRFEPLSSTYAYELEKEISEMKKPHLNLSTFVTKYNALSGTGGHTVDTNDIIGMAKASIGNKAIDSNVSTLTWGQLFEVLDKASATVLMPSKKPNILAHKISPGLTQTLLATATDSILKLQPFVDYQYGSNAPAIMTKLNMNPPPIISDLLLWLLRPGNSLIAGAAKLLLDSSKTRWDLPIVASYYNSGGVPRLDYQDRKRPKPNPWGYYLNDEQYCLNAMAAYNAARVLVNANNNKFKTRLKQYLS